MTFSHHFNSAAHECGQLVMTNQTLIFSFLIGENADSQITAELCAEFMRIYESDRPLDIFDFLDEGDSDSDDSDDENDKTIYKNPCDIPDDQGHQIRFRFEKPITQESILKVLSLIRGIKHMDTLISASSFDELGKAIKEHFQNEKTENRFFNRHKQLERQRIALRNSTETASLCQNVKQSI